MESSRMTTRRKMDTQPKEVGLDASSRDKASKQHELARDGMQEEEDPAAIRCIKQKVSKELKHFQQEFFVPSSKKCRVRRTVGSTINEEVKKNEGSRHLLEKGEYQTRAKSRKEIVTVKTEEFTNSNTRLQQSEGSANNAEPKKDEGSKLVSEKGRQPQSAKTEEFNITEELKIAPENDFFKPISRKHKQSPKRRQSVAVTEKNQTSRASMKLDVVADTGAGGDGTSSFHFDLWMEAKLAAVENAQLCAGKPTHPFFSQLKSGQAQLSALASTDVDKGIPQQAARASDVEELLPLPPFHVTQTSEPLALECDWQKMKFLDPVFAGGRKLSMDLERDSEPLQQESIKLMRLEGPRFQQECLSNRSQILVEANEIFLKELLDYLQEHTSRDTAAEQEKLAEKGHPDLSLDQLENRFTSYYVDRAKRHSQESSSLLFNEVDDCISSKNLLWTDFYQPRSSEEVCGNKDNVKFLNNWLQSWQLKTISWEISMEEDKCQKKNVDLSSDHDRCSLQDDSDLENSSSEDNVMQNVLLLTGPVGCGKSAAVFACAKEQGYTVIEVNASDHRSGALVKQKFGEAMESHRLGKWSGVDNGFSNAPSSLTKFKSEDLPSSLKVSQAEENVHKIKGHNKPIITPDSCTQDEMAQGPRIHRSCEDQQLAECPAKDMTVMLFEDIDLVFEEDRGFMGALAQLAETTKRPVILTSNNKETCLPRALDKLSLDFALPSIEDLVPHLSMICAAEGIPCHPRLIERTVKACQQDLRKLLMLFQFWGQRSSHSKERRQNNVLDTFSFEHFRKNTCIHPIDEENDVAKMTSCKLQNLTDLLANQLFEIDAQHLMWPVLIPLSFPCHLTKIVCDKIQKIVLELEGRASWVAANLAEIEADRSAANANKMKRGRKDNRTSSKIDNTSEENLDEEEEGCFLTPMKSLKEVKVVARSPVLRRKVRRQLATVMSDSEDEPCNNTSHTTKDLQFENSMHVASIQFQGEVQNFSEEQMVQTNGISVCDDSSKSTSSMIASAGSLLTDRCQMSKVGLGGSLYCDVLNKDCKFRRLKRVSNRDSDIDCPILGHVESIEDVGGADVGIQRDPHASSSQLPSNESLEVGQMTAQMNGLNEELQIFELIKGKSASDVLFEEINEENGTISLTKSQTVDTRPSNDRMEAKEPRHAHGMSSKVSCPETVIQAESKLLCECLEVGHSIRAVASCFDMAETITVTESCISYENELLPDIMHGTLQCSQINNGHKQSDDAELEVLGNGSNIWTAGSILTPKLVMHQLKGNSDVDQALISTSNLECVGTYNNQSTVNARTSIDEAANNMWSHLRACREEYTGMLDSNCYDVLKVLCSLATLTDNISVCEMISRFHETNLTAAYEDSGIMPVLENYGASEPAAQLANAALQLCIKECFATFPSLCQIGNSVSAEQIMLALNDTSTLGKAITLGKELDLASGVCSCTGSSCHEQDKRRLKTISTLTRSLPFHAQPKVYRAIMGAGFHEYVGCLARITQLEEVRQTSTSSRRRSRGFYHYLRTGSLNLSEESIAALQQLGQFGNGSVV